MKGNYIPTTHWRQEKIIWNAGHTYYLYSNFIIFNGKLPS